MPLEHLRQSQNALERLLTRAAGTSDTQMYVCNVAGSTVERRIRAAATRAGLPAPRFVRTQAAAAGVRTRYREPWRLGVDRWMALIGARARYPSAPLCLVSIGSAMTIDLLEPDGVHAGGCIVPAPPMMIEVLLSRTAGIRRRAGLRGTQAPRRALAGVRAVSARTLFARDTRTALIAGARQACASLVEQALQEARRKLGRKGAGKGGGVRLLLTGGGAALVAPLLRARHRREPDLVLRGLALIAAAQSVSPRTRAHTRKGPEPA
jgi:type III pantothenate kinase